MCEKNMDFKTEIHLKLLYLSICISILNQIEINADQTDLNQNCESVTSKIAKNICLCPGDYVVKILL